MFCCSGGFFFAVKEVSLLDQGDLGRQSIVQLEQVGQDITSFLKCLLVVSVVDHFFFFLIFGSCMGCLL